jgi:hypothetical protein
LLQFQHKDALPGGKNELVGHSHVNHQRAGLPGSKPRAPFPLPSRSSTNSIKNGNVIAAGNPQVFKQKMVYYTMFANLIHPFS